MFQVTSCVSQKATEGAGKGKGRGNKKATPTSRPTVWLDDAVRCIDIIFSQWHAVNSKDRHPDSGQECYHELVHLALEAPGACEALADEWCCQAFGRSRSDAYLGAGRRGGPPLEVLGDGVGERDRGCQSAEGRPGGGAHETRWIHGGEQPLAPRQDAPMLRRRQ
eukprot:4107687-Pyramimonas_sp.AAC.1